MAENMTGSFNGSLQQQGVPRCVQPSKARISSRQSRRLSRLHHPPNSSHRLLAPAPPDWTPLNLLSLVTACISSASHNVGLLPAAICKFASTSRIEALLPAASIANGRGKQVRRKTSFQLFGIYCSVHDASLSDPMMIASGSAYVPCTMYYVCSSSFTRAVVLFDVANYANIQTVALFSTPCRSLPLPSSATGGKHGQFQHQDIASLRTTTDARNVNL
ncbi:hypothetical protein J3F84DRAFT_145956 [Trichoderma pleuroticola]